MTTIQIHCRQIYNHADFSSVNVIPQSHLKGGKTENGRIHVRAQTCTKTSK